MLPAEQGIPLRPQEVARASRGSRRDPLRRSRVAAAPGSSPAAAPAAARTPARTPAWPPPAWPPPTRPPAAITIVVRIRVRRSRDRPTRDAQGRAGDRRVLRLLRIGAEVREVRRVAALIGFRFRTKPGRHADVGSLNARLFRGLIHNGAAPKIQIDPETYDGRADGELLICEPANKRPMTQRYFLF